MLWAMAEHFQKTLRTWIGQRLACGDVGLAEVREHVAESYRLPLEIYYRATSWCRERGTARGGQIDPDWSPVEVVHDYLADRLGRDEFMEQWEASGLSLRRWLINGLLFYLKERHRALHRGGRGRGGGGGRGRGGGEAAGSGSGWSAIPVHEDPGRDADRLMVGGLVRRAVKQTLAKLDAAGHGRHGRAFVAFYFEQKNVEQTADELGVSPGQVKGMLRLARGRFKASFTELLTRDGVPESRHDEELRAMLEVIHG